MLDKLSKRERIMAIVVAALLPLALIMFLFVYVGGKLADRAEQLTLLETEQRELNLRLAMGRKAAARGEIYRAESLPSDTSKAALKYQAWFADLCEQTLGKQDLNVSMGYPQQVKYGMSETVFNRQAFSISGKCTLQQLTKFLYRFYQARILHRISMFSLVPDTEGIGARQRLTGRLRFNMSFDVAALATADSDRDFATDQREMLRSLDDYLNVLARRDVFGPPNTPPRLATRGSLEFETGQDISVSLAASDADEDQDLKIELVEQSTPAAELVQSDSESAVLTVPPLPRGRHSFLVRATDNGWPNKSSDLELVIAVDDPQPAETVEPDPPTRYAQYAFVSGRTTESGQAVVWIRVPQPEDRLYQLKVGESFELDDRTWTIIEISADQTVIEVDGEHRVYQDRSSLADPVRPPVSAAAGQ